MRHSRDDELNGLRRIHQPFADLDASHAHLHSVDPVGAAFGWRQLRREWDPQRLAADRKPPKVKIPERRYTVAHPNGFDQRWSRMTHRQVTGAATRLSDQLL